MSLLLDKPESSRRWLGVASALGEIVNGFDLGPERDVVVYCFDGSEPGWADLPIAWYQPAHGDAVVNVEKALSLLAARSGSAPISGASAASSMTRGAIDAVERNLRARGRAADSSARYETLTAGGTVSRARVSSVHSALPGQLRSTAGRRADPLSVAGVADTLLAVVLHETGHAVFSRYVTKRWFSELDPYRRSVFMVLEELRSERCQLKRVGAVQGRSLLRRAADVVVDLSTLSEDLCRTGEDGAPGFRTSHVALMSSLCLGRAQYGVFLDWEVREFRKSVEAIVGSKRLPEMEDVWRTFSVCYDTDRDAMSEQVERWVEMFPSETPPASRIVVVVAFPVDDDPDSGDASDSPGDEGSGSGSNRDGEGGSDGDGEGGDSGSSSAPGSASGSPGDSSSGSPDGAADDFVALPGVADGLAESLRRAAESAAENPDYSVHEHGPRQTTPAKTSYDAAQAAGLKPREEAVLPSDRLLAKQLAADLRRLSLSARDRTQALSEAPPGKLSTRAAVQRSAERAAGRMPATKPWRRTKTAVTHAPALTVGVMTDSSGSQGWAEQLSSRLTWIVAHSVTEINGKCAAVAFGDGVVVTLRPSQRPDLRPVVPANGGREEFDHACGVLDTMLNLTSSAAARIVFVLTDGQMVKEHEMEKTAAWVDKLKRAGCAVVWITPDPGNSYRGLPTTPRGATELPVVTRQVMHDPGPLIGKLVGAVKRSLEGRR